MVRTATSPLSTLCAFAIQYFSCFFRLAHLLIPQDLLEDLLRYRHRKSVPELQRLGHSIGGKFFPAMSDDLILSHLAPVLVQQDHEGLDPLAARPFRVGNPNRPVSYTHLTLPTI